ncbi:MAG: ribonuclease Z [Ruminococcaceae bacterium]|nr:ribonuclease Z [Oscillospiraceae bacterium]
MNLIICLDDKNGMMFNKRRQSRDSVLCERVLSLFGGDLYMSTYSAKLFPADAPLTVCDFAACKDKDGFFFAEDTELSLDSAEKIIIYRWNRHYPADKHFNFDLASLGYELTSSTDLTGSSHPVITEQIFKKKGK